MQNENMKRILFLLSAISLSSFVGLTQSALRPEQKQEILRYHSYAKSCITTRNVKSCQQIGVSPQELANQPQGKGMFVSVWDEELADIGQKWLDAGNTGHGHLSGHSVFGDHFGQNIAGGNYPNILFVLLKSWFDEHAEENYTYSPVDGALTAGHYTQVIWGNSFKIGCGSVISGYNFFRLVCNYGPAGNVLGQYPYQLANGANLEEACTSGGHTVSTEYPGLCVHQGPDLPRRQSMPDFSQFGSFPTRAPFVDPSQSGYQPQQRRQGNPSYVPPQARGGFSGAPNGYGSTPQGGNQPLFDPLSFFSGFIGGQMPQQPNPQRQSWSEYPQQGANRSGGQYGGYQGSQQPVSNNKDEPQITELTPEEEAEYERQQQQKQQQQQQQPPPPPQQQTQAPQPQTQGPQPYTQQPQTQLVPYAPQQSRQPNPTGGPYGYQPPNPQMQFQQYSSPPGATNNQGGEPEVYRSYSYQANFNHNGKDLGTFSFSNQSPQPGDDSGNYRATANYSRNGQDPITYYFNHPGPQPGGSPPSFGGWNRQSPPQPQPAPPPKGMRRQMSKPENWPPSSTSQPGGNGFSQNDWSRMMNSGMSNRMQRHMNDMNDMANMFPFGMNHF